MKIRHVYTVVRGGVSLKSNVDLETEKENFEAIKDEPGEHLYGGSGFPESIDVRLEYSSDDGSTWKVADERMRSNLSPST